MKCFENNRKGKVFCFWIVYIVKGILSTLNRFRWITFDMFGVVLGNKLTLSVLLSVWAFIRKKKSSGNVLGWEMVCVKVEVI